MEYKDLKTVKQDGKTYRLFDFPFYGEIHKVFFVASSYRNDGSLAVECYFINEEYYSENGPAENAVDSWAVTTVNLCDPRQQGDKAFADTNNSRELVKFMEEQGLCKSAGAVGQSGYCTYPLMKWNTKKFLAE